MFNKYFLGALAILFIGLKLCHVIDWSWWYVLMPIWLPTAIAAFVGFIYVACVFIGALIKG